MLTKQEQLDALKLAIKTELEGKDLYNTAAKQAKTTLAKETMESLARDEDFHILAIKKFLKNLEEKGEWSDFEKEFKPEEIKATKLNTIFSKALKNVKSEMSGFGDDIKVYKKGIEFENKGMEMYKNLREKSADQNAVKFYNFLYEFEKEHTELLENSLQYLKDPTRFFQDQESWHFEG